MTEIKYLGSALYDKNEANRIIHEYFDAMDISHLTEKHFSEFLSELKKKEDLLRNSPELFQIRKDGVFQYTDENWRCFAAHWFTVFYTYEDDVAYIWYIRPSKSDFSAFL